MKKFPEDPITGHNRLFAGELISLKEWMNHPMCTCSDCEDRDDCQFVGDLYNKDGDCLALK